MSSAMDAEPVDWTVEVLHPPISEAPCVGAGVDPGAKRVFTASYPDGG